MLGSVVGEKNGERRNSADKQGLSAKAIPTQSHKRAATGYFAQPRPPPKMDAAHDERRWLTCRSNYHARIATNQLNYPQPLLFLRSILKFSTPVALA